jgi:hypothetical protein
VPEQRCQRHDVDASFGSASCKCVSQVVQPENLYFGAYDRPTMGIVELDDVIRGIFPLTGAGKYKLSVNLLYPTS